MQVKKLIVPFIVHPDFVVTFISITLRKSFGMYGGVTTGLEPATSAVTGHHSNPIFRMTPMTSRHTSEPFWINEPDWLCAVEFLNDEDTEGRDLAAETIGYHSGVGRAPDEYSVASAIG